MKIKKYFGILVLLILVLSNVIFANGLGNGFDPNIVPNQSINSSLKTPIDKVFGSVILILQILSVAGVIIAGVRYMFIAPDAKADIKKSLKLLIIGLVIVFGAATISEFIRDAFLEVI